MATTETFVANQGMYTDESAQIFQLLIDKTEQIFQLVIEKAQETLLYRQRSASEDRDYSCMEMDLAQLIDYQRLIYPRSPNTLDKLDRAQG